MPSLSHVKTFPDKEPSTKAAPFPIVGIGTSAGGLEALEAFLKHLPDHPDMAFVIVQHLAPDHKPLLQEILAPLTPMPVNQIEDGTLIENNSVYIIPPAKELSIHKRRLYLLDPVSARGLGLPVNNFFESLALDQEERSIGIILSGMGSDGTEGLKAIREKAGFCLVQDPENAKFDGMPLSAIQSGVADTVATAEELPGKLIAYTNNLPLHRLSDDACTPSQSRDLQKIILLLHRHSGQDFSEYKVNTLIRRIERRMGLHQVQKMSRYIRLLQEMPQELDLLLSELLIGVTQFFRDPQVWETLSSILFPSWFNSDETTRHFRIWIPGCSTGEEAYSMAILFQEAIETYKPAGTFSLQIFATDLNQIAIDKAREGLFNREIGQHLSDERLNTYFTIQSGGQLRVRKSIRSMVIFARQNVLMDPPFTKIDLLICRNLLIYLTQSAQEKLLPLFHFSLNPDGYLLLGSSETTGSLNQLFDPIEKKHRLWQKSPINLNRPQVDFPTFMRSEQPYPSQPAQMTKEHTLQHTTEKMILELVSPPSIMINENGDILYISGRTGKFLEPAVGKANWNIFAMAYEPLRYPLESALEECLRLKQTVIRKQLSIQTPDHQLDIDLTLHPLSTPPELKGLILIVLQELSPLPGPQDKKTGETNAHNQHMTGMGKEIARLRAELRHTKKDMQHSQEESRSVNEELQSINEELTTSREEIQSMNEELQTLNTELQRKVDALSLLNDDLNNILNRTEIATLFLDADLKVRLFTAGVTRILNLIPGDVGRHISDIALKLNYPELEKDIQEVLSTLVFHEIQACNEKEEWFSIRIIPYRTMQNLIDGAVITFTDITAIKSLEAHLQQKIKTQNKSEEDSRSQ